MVSGEDDEGRGPRVAPDLLEIGPAGAGWTRQRRRRVAALLLALVVLAGTATLLLRWRAAAAPTFSRDEVFALYASWPTSAGERAGAGADPVRWNPASVSIADAYLRRPRPDTQPASCGLVFTPDPAPGSDDRISEEFAPTGPAATAGTSYGVAVTYRYADPRAAGDRFSDVRAAVRRCPDFREGEATIHLDEVTGRDRVGRSDLAFRFTTSWTSKGRVRLVRFGNTLTWLFTGGSTSTEIPAVDGLPDTVVTGLRAIYRRRG